MANNTHKGTKLANVQETWDQNERNRAEAGPEAQPASVDDPTSDTDLAQLIKREAAEYDRENKEDRLLGGDRATLNDDPGPATDTE